MSFDAKALCSWSCLRRLSSLSSALPSVTLLSVTLLIASPAPGWAQAAIYTPVGVATPTPSGKIVVTNAVCHDEDGSVSPDNVMWLDGNYVKSNTQIQAHTSATVSGVCEWTLFGVRYPQYDETRYISSVGFTDIHPAPQVGGYMTSMNYTPSQSLDTEIPGKSTQLSITNISTLGEHIFKFQTHALTTNCAIPSDSAFATRTVNAVACLPQWLKDQASNTLLPRGKFLTDAPIKIIYQDVSLGSTVQAVVDGWNSALAAAGLTAPQFQNAGNINCDNDLPHCIYLGGAGYTTLTCAPGRCGCSSAGTITNGVFSSFARVTLVADWNADFKKWVISHELGHLLGLGENNTCTTGQTVMAAASCNTTAPVTVAQPSDALPVAKTVYGSAGTKTCGW